MGKHYSKYEDYLDIYGDWVSFAHLAAKFDKTEKQVYLALKRLRKQGRVRTRDDRGIMEAASA